MSKSISQLKTKSRVAKFRSHAFSSHEQGKNDKNPIRESKRPIGDIMLIF